MEAARKHLGGRHCAAQQDTQRKTYRKMNTKQRHVEVHEKVSWKICTCLTSDTDSFWNSAEKEKEKKTPLHIVKITESGIKVYQSMYSHYSQIPHLLKVWEHIFHCSSGSVFLQPTTEESNFVPSLLRHQTLN